MRIMTTNSEDLDNWSQQIIKIGVQKVLNQLQQPFDQVYPEQAIRLLSVLHYMIQKQTLTKEQFLESNIHMITNSLNSSFIVDRLQTDLNLTMSRSVSVIANWEKTPKQYQQYDNFFKAESEIRKNGKSKSIIVQEQREPLNYQQILQLYYTYLKRVCIQQMSGMPLIDCFVIQNIQSLGLRIIEGQRTSKLRFCFNLIIADMIQYQETVLDFLQDLLKQPSQEASQIKEIYYQMYFNSKQLKFYGLINKIYIDQSKLKIFKQNNSMERQKYKICESTNRLHQHELRNEQHFYQYERVQVYNQF